MIIISWSAAWKLDIIMICCMESGKVKCEATKELVLDISNTDQASVANSVNGR